MSALLKTAPVAASEPAAPIDIVVRRIHYGIVKTGTVRSRLPATSRDSRFEHGPVMPHTDAVLAAVTETLTRCAPWLVAYVGPRLWSVCDADATDDYACRSNWYVQGDGRVAYEHRGLARWNEGKIFVAASHRLPEVVGTVHHEIWHAVESHGIHVLDLDVVDAAAKRGKPRPGHYLASQLERRARAYESWALARDEGWRPLSIFSRPLSRIDRIFEYVYSGRLAKDYVRRGAGVVQGGSVKRGLELVYAWPLCLLWPLAGAMAVHVIA